MSDDAGGSAFPEVVTRYEGSGGEYTMYVESDGGMTLRDYFAAKAMQAIASALSQGIRPADITNLASDAYGIADAMIAARSRT